MFYVILILIVISALVKMLFVLGRPGRTYASPVICNEEYISGCSGGHVADRRHPAIQNIYSGRVITRKEPEIKTDQPIEVPNWPVKVGRGS